MKALVVGGTGPTGPFIVNGLITRGFEVSIFHRGTHEADEIPPEVEHIHGDPHFQETIDEAMKGRTFDVAIATYGRIRFIAESLAGKVGSFIGIGGMPAYRGFANPRALFPSGLRVPTPEDAPLVDSEQEHRFSWLIAQTEAAVFESHPTAAFYRYPYVYGPRQLVPREWSVIRRILDKRPFIILPDAGLMLYAHGYAGNLAHAVLLAVDQPEASAGEIFNCGDEEQLSLRQFVEIIAQQLGHEWEIVSMPYKLAKPAHSYILNATPHNRVLDLAKIKHHLGYKDLYGVEDAIARTVSWYVENQPERGGAIERSLQDTFNYHGEDRLVASYREAMTTLESIPFDTAIDRPHPYAHPKEPGQSRDHRNR